MTRSGRAEKASKAKKLNLSSNGMDSAPRLSSVRSKKQFKDEIEVLSQGHAHTFKKDSMNDSHKSPSLFEEISIG